MRNAFAIHFAVTLLLVGCAESKKSPMHWEETNYALCTANPTGATLPYDIAVSLNRTDLPFGRYDDFSSMRPHILSKDGTAQEFGSDLIQVPGQTELQFSDWSLDGQSLYVNRIWEEPQHAMLEQMEQTVILDSSSYLVDVLKVEMNSGSSFNATDVERTSFYNTNGREMASSGRVAFGALKNGAMRMFSMLPDGTDKQPLLKTSGFAYGFDFSKDGQKYAFHSEYQVYIGDFATGVETHVPGCHFEFIPVFSPDSQKIAFFCGASNNGPDIWTANVDGSNARKLTGRGGFSGTVPIIDTFDYHGGSSDDVVWESASSLIYAQRFQGNVELFRIDVNTLTKTQLTFSNGTGKINSYPSLSVDGKYLTFISSTNGNRDTYILDLSTLAKTQITNVGKGCSTFHPKFRPI